MSRDEVKIDLDTRPAHSELRSLTGAKTSLRQKISAKAKGRGKRLAGVAVGALGGRNSAYTGPVEPTAEALRPTAARLKQELQEKLGYSPRARQDALKSTTQAFRNQAGRGDVSQAARDFYRTELRRFELIDKGRLIAAQTFTGPSAAEVAKTVAYGTLQLTSKAFQYFEDVLRGRTDGR